jgi:hypothetical protein
MQGCVGPGAGENTLRPPLRNGVPGSRRGIGFLSVAPEPRLCWLRPVLISTAFVVQMWPH